MSDFDQKDEDEPPSGIYELKSSESSQKKRRFLQRKSDNIVIGINLATILSILYVSHTYVTSMEKRVTTAEVRLSTTEVQLFKILDRLEQHIEKVPPPCP